MTLRVYNTLSGKKEDFKPVNDGKVGMYVCGPTVYDSCHIGHARSVVVFDVIYRYLKETGLDVTYIRNFTDIDDKIIKRANELSLDYKAVSEKYIQEFYEDMDALNVLRATNEPKATEHIDQMIQMISQMIEKGIAYPVDGDVYYKVDSFDAYGKLSGRKLEDMEAGARIDVDERKLNPFDFALWKSSKPDEPFWESPWGKGRPGWHIECSVMSSKFLGDTFDIHGGGKDLIFPHHENEIAQSEGLSCKCYAKYWIHNGFVNINHEKMSKSLGNFTVIKDVLKKFHPEAVRMFLLSNHYRSPIDFSDQSMEDATVNLEKLYHVLERVDDIFPEIKNTANDKNGQYYKDFCLAMDDDFNSAKGIAVLLESIRNTNRLLDEKDPSSHLSQISSNYSDIQKMSNLIGIGFENPQDYFNSIKSKAVETHAIDEAVINQLILDRNNARKEKNFGRADEIRDELLNMNIILKDGPEGTTWEVKQ